MDDKKRERKGKERKGLRTNQNSTIELSSEQTNVTAKFKLIGLFRESNSTFLNMFLLVC